MTWVIAVDMYIMYYIISAKLPLPLSVWNEKAGRKWMNSSRCTDHASCKYLIIRNSYIVILKSAHLQKKNSAKFQINSPIFILSKTQFYSLSEPAMPYLKNAGIIFYLPKAISIKAIKDITFPNDSCDSGKHELSTRHESAPLAVVWNRKDCWYWNIQHELSTCYESCVSGCILKRRH